MYVEIVQRIPTTEMEVAEVAVRSHKKPGDAILHERYLCHGTDGLYDTILEKP